MSSEATDSAVFYEFLAWLEVNKKRLITGALVVGVLAFFISLAVYLKKQKQIEASNALIRVTATAGETGGPSAADLLKVAADYPGTAAAERATYQAAVAYYGEHKYTEALDQFKRFQNAYGSSRLMPQSAIGIAACLESMDKIDEAMKGYQDIVARYAAEPVSAQAKYALGRLNEDKKQYEQAVKYYQDLSSSMAARSFWHTDAADRLQRLYKEFPNLVPKPVAPVAPAASAAPAAMPALETVNKAAAPAAAPAAPAQPAPAKPAGTK